MGSLKNLTLKARFTKNQYRGRLPQKEGLGQFVGLRRGDLARKKGGMVFLRGVGFDTPMYTMEKEPP